MAGIYIHVPFCKQICYYCDFYKVANFKEKDVFIKALIKEINIKREDFDYDINTVYFGGGTPSVLTAFDIEIILNELFNNYRIGNEIEFTLELNPDDISGEYINSLYKFGVNRVSIGVQSFNDVILKFLNRRHNSKAALNSIDICRNSGITNISVDLIYGIPSQSLKSFKEDLELVNKLNIKHLSAYHLGIEDNTVFGKYKKLEKIKEIEEEESKLFYQELIEWSDNTLYEHYEVSNFVKNQKYSQHNKNYWFNVPYISFGPSAHSYYNKKRYFNISNLKKYCEGVLGNKNFQEYEELDINTRFNEYVMLRLRTKWGLSLDEIDMVFGIKYRQYVLRIFLKYKDSGYIRIEKNTLKLTDDGFFVSDYLISEFFITGSVV